MAGGAIVWRPIVEGTHQGWFRDYGGGGNVITVNYYGKSNIKEFEESLSEY